MADPNVASNLTAGKRRGPPRPPKAALAGIRARSKAKYGKNPSNAAVLATYRRNTSRSQALSGGRKSAPPGHAVAAAAHARNAARRPGTPRPVGPLPVGTSGIGKPPGSSGMPDGIGRGGGRPGPGSAGPGWKPRGGPGGWQPGGHERPPLSGPGVTPGPRPRPTGLGAPPVQMGGFGGSAGGSRPGTRPGGIGRLNPGAGAPSGPSGLPRPPRRRS